MDWLEASALFLLGWFGKKLKWFAEAVLDLVWFLVSCTPPKRRYFVASVYLAFLEAAKDLRDSGQLNGAALERVRRFILWANPKFKAWMERVGPGSPGWPLPRTQTAQSPARPTSGPPSGTQTV